MSEIETYRERSMLADQMDYAKAISTGSLLPREYQNNPANVLIAVGLGSSMGLSPAESLYRITVIQGKPTASAELIAANVRKAGHKLRVRGDERSCTATILRADDPDYEFTVTRDLAWAQSMGLTGKDNYKKQPGTMLQWRAITAAARLACPEALYGVAYSTDEMQDVAPAPRAGGLSSALGQTATFDGTAPTATVTVEQVEPPTYYDAEANTAAGSPEPEPESPLLNTSGTLARQMFALMGEAGITEKADRLLYVSDTVGREVATSKELTDDDARAVILSLKADAAAVRS